MLRQAQASDLEPVFGIYMHMDNVPFLGHDPMPIDAFQPIFDDLVAGGAFFVWEDAGRIRGFCRARRRPGRAAHVVHLGPLAVDPTERGTGLARTLLTTLIDRLRRQGVRRVELAVSEDNLRALAFYRKLGFRHEGTMRAAYKRAHQDHYVDDLILGRLLAPPDADT